MISYICGDKVLEQHELPNSVPSEGEHVRLNKESYVVVKLLWFATHTTDVEVYLRTVNDEDIREALP